VSVARPDVGNGTVIELYSGSGVVAANLLQSEVLSKYFRQAVAIPNGARFFRLTNQAGVGSANLSAIFELHL
jgi:16S rRNA G966 N2-methylase RsmD